MKIKTKELAGSRRQFEIEIPFDMVSGEYDRIYSEIQKYAQIPGFRTGKAPRYLVEAHYKDKAGEEVKNRLILDNVKKAAADAGVNIIGSPAVLDVIFEEGGPFKFKAEISVRPEVKLKSYKGLKSVKQAVQVSTEEVDKVIEELQERHAQLKDAEGRSSKENDWCLCDVEISVEGKPGEKNDAVWFPLNPKSTKPEFLSQLLGVNPGDSRTVKTTLPANYPRKEQAGKEAVFIITINQVKEKIMPIVDDDFAKDVGGFKSLLELRGNIREELARTKEQEAVFKIEEDLIGQLIKSTDFEAPSVMVDYEEQRLLKEAHSRLEYMGYKKEDIGSQEAAIKDKLKDEAVKRIKGFLILEKLAEIEGMSVGKEEVDKRVEFLAARSKRGAEEMKNYLMENNLLEDIKSDILQDKALEFLVANAKIEEK
ncbi:MAG: trigger factor [Candidatus Omnitrophota bacterium]